MRIHATLVATLAISCGGHGSDEPAPPAPAPQLQPKDRAPDPEPVAVTQPDFPDWTRSLELRRTVSVRLEPSDEAKPIGNIAIDTRVGWTRTATGKGCDRAWVEIKPHGWVCGKYLEPSKKPPYGQEVPHLDRGEIVPGIYGKVTAPSSVTYAYDKGEKKKPAKDKKKNRADKDRRDRDKKKGPVTSTKDVDNDGDDTTATSALPKPKMVEDKPLVGSVNVRDYDEVTVDNKLYWKIAQKENQYVLASAITRHQPSRFAGARMGDDTGRALPIAFVWPRANMVATYSVNTAKGGGVNRQLFQRTPVAILEADNADKPTMYRIGEREWISAADVRVFKPAPLPPMLTPGERWIDVDLDTQILVALEGDVAVYATMVSSGGKDTATETGVYRMWRKESEADMKGLNGEDPYSVATVPWTQFFSPEKGLALHTAYWHDGFGRPRSHGCVNLAPRDARWLYFWSDPQVPPGWTMAAGVVEAPGSIVRVRNKETPAPEIKGYARDVQEIRQRTAPR